MVVTLHHRFVTFEDDSAVERVFGAGRMHTIGGKSVEVKPATPRGSGPTGIAMSRGFPMVLPGRGMARAGFAEMTPAAAAGYPGGPYQGYAAGMVPYATGGRIQPMVRNCIRVFAVRRRCTRLPTQCQSQVDSC